MFLIFGKFSLSFSFFLILKISLQQYLIRIRFDNAKLQIFWSKCQKYLQFFSIFRHKFIDLEAKTKLVQFSINRVNDERTIKQQPNKQEPEIIPEQNLGFSQKVDIWNQVSHNIKILEVCSGAHFREGSFGVLGKVLIVKIGLFA